MTLWQSIMLLLSLLLLAVLWCHWQFRHASQGRRVLLGILHGLALWAILTLIFPPLLSTPAITSVTLLTPGTHSNWQQNEPSAHRQIVQWQRQQKDIKTIADAGQLPLQFPHLQHIDLLGYGLTAQQRQSLAHLDVSMTGHQGVANGLVAMSWSSQLTLGQPLTIRGRILNGQGQHQVKLYAPSGQIIAQQQVDKQQQVELSGPTKATGNYLYHVQLDNGPKQPVAVSITPIPPVNITIMQSSPSFDTRQFSAWARQQGHKVTIFSNISKNAGLNQFINQELPTHNGLTPGWLASQQLLIIDARRLQALDDSQTTWLNQAIKEGLGVLVIFRQPPAPSGWQHWPAVGPLVNKAPVQPVWPSWAGMAATLQLDQHGDQASVDSNLFVSNQGMALKSGNQIVPLIWSATSPQKPLVVMFNRGLGHIGVSLLATSYQWHQQQQAERYGAFWQTLINQLSRAPRPPITVHAGTPLIMANERFKVCAAKQSTVELANSRGETVETLKMAIDSWQPLQSCSFVRVPDSGWMTIRAPLWQQQRTFYVYPANTWTSWRQHHRLQLNQAFMENPTSPSVTTATSLTPVNPLWSWLLLLVSMTLLWLEQKWRGTN